MSMCWTEGINPDMKYSSSFVTILCRKFLRQWRRTELNQAMKKSSYQILCVVKVSKVLKSISHQHGFIETTKKQIKGHMILYQVDNVKESETTCSLVVTKVSVAS